MSRPEDIPKEVWEDARPFAAEYYGGDQPRVVGFIRVRGIVARAIMAETERCAKIAEVLHGTATAREIRKGRT